MYLTRLSYFTLIAAVAVAEFVPEEIQPGETHGEDAQVITSTALSSASPISKGASSTTVTITSSVPSASESSDPYNQAFMGACLLNNDAPCQKWLMVQANCAITNNSDVREFKKEQECFCSATGCAQNFWHYDAGCCACQTSHGLKNGTCPGQAAADLASSSYCGIATPTTNMFYYYTSMTTGAAFTSLATESAKTTLASDQSDPSLYYTRPTAPPSTAASTAGAAVKTMGAGIYVGVAVFGLGVFL